ncbi:hypothetical protein QTG54_010842 [Skeletonema marinoi]|uniref:Uncharacterized protein n=1 Tax=Skeletonema marinoi TaxID=267567 RepID=A0AAD8Y272_9STRA|nr:hypothetical protein QTG54_010842 [Skeletonema marinoi]
MEWIGISCVDHVVLCSLVYFSACILVAPKAALGESLSSSSDNDEEEETQPSSEDEKDTPVVQNTEEEEKEEEEEEEDDESEITIETSDVPGEINAIETSLSQEVSMLGIYGAEEAPQSPTEAEGIHNDATDVLKDSTNGDVQQEQSSETVLAQLGTDVYVGVFYFYTSSLFILSIAMKDGLILVLGQSVSCGWGLYRKCSFLGVVSRSMVNPYKSIPLNSTSIAISFELSLLGT